MEPPDLAARRRLLPGALAIASGIALCLGVLRQAPLPAQEQPSSGAQAQTDPWTTLHRLVGTWEGQIDGRLGTGRAVRRYEMVLGDHFLLGRHSSVRPPQEATPRGDTHEEIGIFSFDPERGVVVYRQFVIEGFVNRYTCEVEPARFVCTSESVEGGAGMQARWSVEIPDRFGFRETFELAGPDQELTPLFTNRWTRIPDLGD